MRRATFRLLVSLFTFAVGLAAATLWMESRRPVVLKLEDPPCLRPPLYENFSGLCSGADFSVVGDIPNLGYCELMRDADAYDGRIVRLHGRSGGHKHAMLISDANCPGVTVVLVHPARRDEIERTLEKAWGSKDWWVPLDFTAIGRFKRGKLSPDNGDIWGTAAPLQFELMSVEKASKLR